MHQYQCQFHSNINGGEQLNVEYVGGKLFILAVFQGSMDVWQKAEQVNSPTANDINKVEKQAGTSLITSTCEILTAHKAFLQIIPFPGLRTAVPAYIKSAQ